MDTDSNQNKKVEQATNSPNPTSNVQHNDGGVVKVEKVSRDLGSKIPIGAIMIVAFLMATLSGLWLAMYALYLYRGGQLQ